MGKEIYPSLTLINCSHLVCVSGKQRETVADRGCCVGKMSVIQVNLDMMDSMGPEKLVRHIQNPLYTYDEYLICIGLGPSISSVICKNPSYSGPSYPSSPVFALFSLELQPFWLCFSKIARNSQSALCRKREREFFFVFAETVVISFVFQENSEKQSQIEIFVNHLNPVMLVFIG